MQTTERITRREFSHRTATALAAPFIAPAAVLGQGDKKAPSDRFTLGFIGVGKMNRGHLRRFLGEPDVQVLAVCDVDTTRREHAQKTVDEHNGKQKKKGTSQGCAAYGDFRELLAREDIDAVVIATPDHWHAIPVIEACKAGKDIYCEKPLSLTIREAQLMAEAARKSGCVFQTGSQQRSSHEFRRACELVRSGRIGRVQRVEVDVGGPSRWCDLPGEKLEPGLDWDMWLGPAPERPYNSVLSPRGVHDHFPNWRSYREYSGGGMTDWGAHHFDIAQWGLGMDDSGPVEVIPPDDPEAGHGVTYRYANGVEMVHGSGNGVRFIGTDGEVFVKRGKLETKPASLLEEPGDDLVGLYDSPGHRRDWLNAMHAGTTQPICPAEIGARSVTVCHLGNLAYWHDRRLQWDPVNWRFVGDEKANAWLDRDRRDPWTLPEV